ncbi:acetyl-mannosamine transferase [Dulcicalothrix desertica PCC 7102]|uniref:Acetyl-mannosamine transferase n=1 Tax=Dulcicalothrix desertica PCC 7102 TaxID=232991 RepID=A0A433UVZ2_9CYAN|nr:WecB/TagA/CpsF family glycosyltransferase [Dulcicalothrix desertica]RUS98021.1 acetyl-mannosamine transferase [Dulcicalothrix desertica PCC 7102]TWH54509.1 exopolysaccharide biosynthesis WecB/TagA/CpsF family protein [Dulcicalothrix desertica PCC 7102]
MNKVKILNLEIDNLSKVEFLDTLQSGVVFTPNVDHLMKLQKDPEFVQAYSVSNYKVCDSQILLLAARLLGTPIREKISGSDLLPAFYTHHQQNESIKIFLLGAREGVAAQAQQNINLKIGRNIVVGSYSPSFGFENNDLECQQIVEIINNSGATVLVIGVGAPKQEKWICKYKEQLQNIKIFMALGATIDFEAGNMKRAPKWISQIGFEWLFRLLCEPKRLWKRYLIEDIPFLLLILKQKLNLYLTKDYLKKNSKDKRHSWHTAGKY